MDERTSELERRAFDRIMLELTNRTFIMAIHGTLLFAVGLMMAITGAPSPIEESFGPWSRIVLGLSAMASGSLILFGAAETDNTAPGWAALLAGFGSGMLWHLGLATAYATAALSSDMMILEPGAPFDPSVTSRGYIPLIYVGYVLLTSVHLRTVWKLGPPPR